MDTLAFKNKTATTRRAAGYRETFELTLPAPVRRQIAPGDFFRAELIGSQLVLRPANAPDPEQSWYWTAGWQKREQQADSDVKAGRLAGPFPTVRSFMKGLKKK